MTRDRGWPAVMLLASSILDPQVVDAVDRIVTEAAAGSVDELMAGIVADFEGEDLRAEAIANIEHRGMKGIAAASRRRLAPVLTLELAITPLWRVGDPAGGAKGAGQGRGWALLVMVTWPLG